MTIRQASPDREAGVTVTEMVIVVALLVLIVGFVLGSFSSMQTAESGNEIRQQGIDNAMVAMATATRDVRSTAWDPVQRLSRVVTATDTTATFYADVLTTTSVNNCPLLVTLTLDTATGKLTETRVDPTQDPVTPTACVWTSAARTVTLAVNLVATKPLFQYFGSPLTGQTLIAAPVPAGSLGAIAAVTIDMQVRPPSKPTLQPTELVERVRLVGPTSNILKGSI